MTKGDKAKALFLEGYNCAQAVFGAFCEDFGFDFETEQLIILLVGMVVAFLVSIFVIKFLLGYIKKHDFKVFGWYRIILGILVLACGIFGVI